MRQPMTHDARAAAAAQAFALAATVTGGTCDALDCPAFAARKVVVYGQDFRFCLHHWHDHCRRLPATAVAPPAVVRPPAAARPGLRQPAASAAR